jgi:hypothetical protein
MGFTVVLDRDTKQLLQVTAAALPQYPDDEWIHNPDLTAVQGLPIEYWKISGNTVLEMTAQEKLAVDGSLLTQHKQNRNDALWQAAWDWNFAYISGGTYSLMDNIVAKSNAILNNPGSTPEQIALANMALPMAVGDQQWVKNVWGTYYQRRAQIWAATNEIQVAAVSLDFTFIGEPPYSVGTLMGVGLALGI